MKWFTVRVVFRHGEQASRAAVYEERLLIYHSDTVELALDRAQRDVVSYLDANPEFAVVGEPSVFVLSEHSMDLDGAEVWSCLHLGPRNADEFWVGRYEKYPPPVQGSLGRDDNLP